MDAGYAVYLAHLYTHEEPREGCPHCFPPPPNPAAWGDPFETIKGLSMDDPRWGKRTTRKRSGTGPLA